MTHADSHPKTRSRNHGLDLIRALAIIYVVFFWHLFEYTTALPNYKFRLTFDLTNIVLGAFVFSSGYLMGGKAGESAATFFRKRFARIYLLFIPAILAFKFTGIIEFWSQALQSALLISSFNPPPPSTLWFVMMILIFYIVTPLLFRATGNLFLYFVTGAALTTAFVAWEVFFELDTRVLLYFPTYLLGLAIRNLPEIRNFLNRTFYLNLALFTGLEAGSLWDIISEENRLILDAAISAFGALVIFQIMERIRVGPSKAIEKISYAAFCMYLFHRPIIVILTAITYPTSPTLQAIYLVTICIPIIFLVSWFIQAFVDKHRV